MRSKRFGLCVIITVLTALFVNNSALADWPMSAANPQRSSRSADEVAGLLKFEWFEPITPYIPQKVQLIAALDTLYLSTSEGLYALDPDTGQTKWIYKTDMPLGNSPTIADGIAYVGCFDKKLHAADAKTGKGLWTFEAGAGFDTNPLVVDGAVYAGCRDGFFYAVDTATGNLRWKFRTDGPILFSAAYADGIVFFASQDCHAYALNAADGSLEWKSEKLPGAGFRSYWPVVFKDRVIFAGTNNYRKGVEPGKMPSPIGNIWSVDRTVLPADTKWGDQLGMSGMRGPVIGKRLEDGRIDRSIVLDFFKRKPYARTYFILDRATGKENETAPMLWSADDGACNRYPPLVGSDGLLYQNMKIMWNPHWMRGHISGWWFGTPYIWTPSAHHKANDEPLAWSAAGNIVYWNHCSHRSAGAFDITAGNPHHMEIIEQQDDRWRGTLPYRNPDLGREWVYFDYEAINTLSAVQRQKGTFAYGYHGDRNPVIPYKNRVYWHLHNGVVAFSKDGQWPKSIRHTLNAEKLNNLVSTPVRVKKYLAGLLTHLTTDDRAWPSFIQQRNYSIQTQQQPEWFWLFKLTTSDAARPDKVLINRKKDGSGTATFTTGDKQMTITVSQSTSAILLDSDCNTINLRGKFTSVACLAETGPEIITGSGKPNASEMTQSWLLVWYGEEYHPRLTQLRRRQMVGSENLGRYSGRDLPMWTPTPVLISLQHKPKHIELDNGGLRINFDNSAGTNVIIPLFGLQKIGSANIKTWADNLPKEIIERANALNMLAKAYPSLQQSNWRVDDNTGDAILTCKYTFTEIADDWNTPPLKAAPVGPNLALAAWDDSPIKIDGTLIDFKYPLGLGRLACVFNSDTITATLPAVANIWRKPLAQKTSTLDPKDPLHTKLITEINKMLTAGHLYPGMTSSGQGDNQWHQFALNDYFHNPSDTITTLLTALPLLPEELQTKVRDYVKQEFTDYPPYEISHTGWAAGSPREIFTLPPQAQADLHKHPAAKWRGWGGIPPHNLYACAVYADEFGGAEEIYDKCKNLLHSRYFDWCMPYIINLNIAGHIGYLRLAHLAKATPARQNSVESRLLDLLVLRAALSKSPKALSEAGFEYGAFDWTVDRYLRQSGEISYKRVGQGRVAMHPTWVHGRYEFTIDFVNLVPELAAFMKQYCENEVAHAVDNYSARAPYWFVPWVTEFAGEGTIVPLYDIGSQFQARAMILGRSRSELEKYIDVPAFPRGDLFYIQNLISTIEADRH